MRGCVTLAQHSNESVRWGTPAEWIEREREVFDGPIHFDPCSEAEFNAVVGAEHYFSLEERGEDGLKLPWPHYGLMDGINVHINPPGGLVREFWRKTLIEPAVRQCMWTGFAMNQLNLLADEIAHPTDFSIVYLRSRIKFVPHSRSRCKACHGNGVVVEPGHVDVSSVFDERYDEPEKCKSCKGTGKVSGERPSHANYLCGMGVDPSRFERVYKDLGAVRHGRLAK